MLINVVDNKKSGLSISRRLSLILSRCLHCTIANVSFCTMVNTLDLVNLFEELRDIGLIHASSLIQRSLFTFILLLSFPLLLERQFMIYVRLDVIFCTIAYQLLPRSALTLKQIAPSTYQRLRIAQLNLWEILQRRQNLLLRVELDFPGDVR